MLSQLRSFLVVVEEGSLHRAADRLRMSQPALSRQMQALEHEVGGRLLERTSTGVEPTNGGYALLKKMKPVLAAYDRAMLEVRRELQGEANTAHLFREDPVAGVTAAYPLKLCDYRRSPNRMAP